MPIPNPSIPALAQRSKFSGPGSVTFGTSAAAATTARLTEARYRNGVDSFLDSLIAQRSLFAARQQLVGIRLAELQNRATLYRVLGTVE